MNKTPFQVYGATFKRSVPVQERRSGEEEEGGGGTRLSNHHHLLHTGVICGTCETVFYLT